MNTKILNAFNKVKTKTVKHSPEILAVTGVVGIVTSGVMACKATLKLKDILTEKESDMQTVHEVRERLNNGEVLKLKDGSDYTEKDLKKDITTVYIQIGRKIAKLYAPAVILGTLSVVSMLASNNILRKRNAALTAAYAAVEKGFKEYRKNVVERFGEKVDYQLAHNLKEVEVEETVVDEKGKQKTVKKTVEVANGTDYSPYARIFDESNPNWEKSSEHNMFFLKSVEMFANDKLRAKGRLFLNEIYEDLGFEPTAAGQVVGWEYDPSDETKDSYVSFGIHEIYNVSEDQAERKTAFVNGYERSIVLDFNVDGNILKNM